MSFLRRLAGQATQPQDSSASLEPIESFGLFEFGKENHNEVCAVDIVAVHGLDGHYRSTWEYHQSNIKKLWLEDFLIDQLQEANITARILSYGYDSASVFTKSVTSIDGEAARLLNKLDLKRDLEHEKKRPIIFIAYSLGGLIVKKSMILAWERSSLYGALLESIRGIVFLGVPHRGADIAYWASLPANIIKYGSLGFRGSTDFLKSLEKNSEAWRTISKQFVERGESLQIRTFFETRKIGNTLIVDEDSARLNLPNERAIGLSDSDHNTICKFSHANSQRYEPVWKGIRNLAREIIADPRQSLHKPSEEELEFLRDLYTSDYERHKNRNPERAPGTCEWVFDHPEYLNWESKTTSSLLWVSADPGCGKSVLASFLIDKFKSTEFQEVLPSTVCFFFFKDDSDEQDNAISAISSILHQLFSAIPHLIKHALEWYQIKGKKLFHELRSLWNIFMSATSDASSKKVICVIDGLDERRNPSRDGLFQLLSDFCAKSTRQGEERTQLKIILLSRPYSFIEDALYHPLMIRMKMEDKSDLTGADVELVIRNRVNKFGRKRNIPDQVQKRLIDRLINYSGQTFLWVSLVLADLESSLRVSEMKLVELISQIPTNLNTMYEKILGKSPSPKDAQKILYIILGAIRPLSLAEMNIAFVIKPEDQGYEDLELEPTIERTIRNLCGLFVKVVDSKIYLVHQTAREFLLNINNSNVGDLNTWQNSLDLLEADNILAQICITYLMFKVFQEQPLESSQEHTGDRSKTRYLEKHSFLVYAATNWILHFRKIQNRATSVMIELVLHLFDMQSERGQTWFQILQASKDRHHDLRFSTGDALLCVASYCGCETIVDLLLQKGADLNSRNSVDATPLMLAISEGHDIVIKLLLEEGADFENQSFPTSTALQLATLKGNESMVKLLLERGANPNKRNVLNKTMLEAAASQEGDNTIPRALMAMGAESDPAVFNGSTALHFAARRGHKSMVRLLFEKGALLDVQNARGNTALHFAAIRGRASVVIFLVEKGALLEVRNAEGNTALLSAARKGHKSVVEVLLEKGASLKDHNGEGDEALHSAASNWRETTVKYLLEKHTCVDVQNNEGQTAMHLAAKDGYESVIRLLLQCNANINVQDWKGRTPLHRAVMTWNNSETVRFLLANNASIDVQDEQGKTAVHLAIEHEELFTCQLLVENIAKIDVQDHDGNTALHLAVERGYIWAVRLLLENGADHNLLNRNGNTALHLAVEERHNWAFRLSFENGADRNLLNRDEYSPLDWAILKKRSSMIKLLNDYGAHSQISLMSDDMMEEKMLDY